MDGIITRFGFQCPNNGVDVGAEFDHETGRLVLVPNDDDRKCVDRETWDEARAFCEKHSGNYYYLRDVRNTLRSMGVDASDIPY